MQWRANNSRQIWKYWNISPPKDDFVWYCWWDLQLVALSSTCTSRNEPSRFHPLWKSILGSSTFCSSYGSNKSFIAHVLPKGLLWMDKRSVHYFPARSILLAGVEVRTLMGVRSIILGVTAPFVAGCSCKIYNDSHLNDNQFGKNSQNLSNIKSVMIILASVWVHVLTRWMKCWDFTLKSEKLLASRDRTERRSTYPADCRAYILGTACAKAKRDLLHMPAFQDDQFRVVAGHWSSCGDWRCGSVPLLRP